METAVIQRPWQHIRELLETGDIAALSDYLDDLRSDETLRAVLRLTPDEQVQLLLALPPDDAAELIDDVPEAHAAAILDDLPPKDAASIVGTMNSDQVADLLGELRDADRHEILEQMDPEDAAETRRLIDYSPDSAGGLMMTEFLSFRGPTRLGEVMGALATGDEDFPRYHLPEIFVVSPRMRLRGKVNLTEISFDNPRRQLAELLQPADSVSVNAELDELEEFFDEHDQPVAPVIDAGNRLIGVLRRRAVFEAIADRADEDALKRHGIVGGEELRSMPILLRSKRRLSWLSVNILLNILAASVIAAYQETLAAAIALAVFLPIVSDMSGCSGNQAVAVSLRELTLGVIKPADLARVWVKEAWVGIINGAALGMLIAATAWLWKGEAWLGLVVGSALALNTVIAVSIGGTIPLILRRFRMDPALASGPVLTTITDMCGFFLVLSLASLAMPAAPV